MSQLRHVVAVPALDTNVAANGTYPGWQSGNLCVFDAKDLTGRSQSYQFDTKVGVRGLRCKVSVTVYNGVATSSSDT